MPALLDHGLEMLTEDAELIFARRCPPPGRRRRRSGEGGSRDHGDETTPLHPSASHPDYATLPARLRMNVIANPGVDKAHFELWSLAVSAINAGKCTDAHDQVLRKAGLSREAIQQAVRIASVTHAMAATLDCEARLAA